MYAVNCRVLLNVDRVAMFHMSRHKIHSCMCWLRPLFSINGAIVEICTYWDLIKGILIHGNSETFNAAVFFVLGLDSFYKSVLTH